MGDKTDFLRPGHIYVTAALKEPNTQKYSLESLHELEAFYRNLGRSHDLQK